MLGTTGKRLEKIGIPDFIDVVYSYSINSEEMRNDFRSAMLSYIFDYSTETQEEDMTFDGFQKQALSIMGDLDAFTM